MPTLPVPELRGRPAGPHTDALPGCLPLQGAAGPRAQDARRDGGLEYWARRTKAGNYFLYYDNGKSAVRLQREASRMEFAPRSVHVLCPEDELEALRRDSAAWTNFSEQELPQLNLQWMRSRGDETAVGAKVLHYPATHFDRLFRKYDHLKGFPAVRFGGGLVVPPSFHLEARDCYVAHAAEGEDVQKQKLKELLEHAAMLLDPGDAELQFQSGTIVRIHSVQESLRRGFWVAPSALVDCAQDRWRRRPTVEQMERIRALPRCDAEVLLRANCDGGLLRQPEACLDALAQRLEGAGWAACSLGAHPALIAKALKEAQAVEGSMAPGTTVIKNQAVDQRIPKARRGDKILWLQEQGLSGPGAAQGATPTLAMLEEALSDIGLQLGLRLQQGPLRLRITERCDAMLACYEGGGANYGAHIDNADGDGRVDGRILTAVLYLNPGWDRANGGELAIFQAESGELGQDHVQGRWHEVWPEAGTLVLFRADRMLHEVRPAHARRYALSLWFCGQHLAYGGDDAPPS